MGRYKASLFLIMSRPAMIEESKKLQERYGSFKNRKILNRIALSIIYAIICCHKNMLKASKHFSKCLLSLLLFFKKILKIQKVRVNPSNLYWDCVLVMHKSFTYFLYYLLYFNFLFSRIK
jgi:hypothetical protein